MWTTRFGKRGLYEFSMCLTEQEGVTGDGFVVFFGFCFFCQFGGDSWVSGCLWTFLEDVKLLQRLDVFIGQGSRGFAILLCNFCFKKFEGLFAGI